MFVASALFSGGWYDCNRCWKDRWVSFVQAWEADFCVDVVRVGTYKARWLWPACVCLRLLVACVARVCLLACLLAYSLACLLACVLSLLSLHAKVDEFVWLAAYSSFLCVFNR